MRKNTTITETKTIITYVCDNCEDENAHYTYKCMICNKDVCNKCCYGIDEWECNLKANTPSYNGDYPSDYICKTCWETGLAYRHNIQTIRDKAEQAEEKIWEIWKQNERNKQCGKQ